MSLSDSAPPRVVAIRGAIDVASDSAEDIRAGVRELVWQINQRNGLGEPDIISAQFTMTTDLRSIFPATAARAAGWAKVPMLCSAEVDVPGALPRCIRVLVHVYLTTAAPVHVYLGAAASLRPDLATDSGAAN